MYPYNRTPQMQPNKMPNNQMSNIQTANNKMTNIQMPNNQMPNNKTPINQVPNIQMPNNQMPNNQVPKNQIQTQETRRKPTGDKRILELLELAMMETAQEAGTYQSLMPLLKTSENRALLQKIYLENIKHMRLLQDVIYQIGGKRSPLLNIPKVDLNESLDSELKKSFLMALENSAFFRNIYFSLPEGELRDTLMELFTDKQHQALILQFLYGINRMI